MSASSLLIQHAQVSLPSGEYTLGDVEVQVGKIIRVDNSLSESISESTVIDATGLTLLPGVIDPQVHF